jgi:ABC-2 type transport system permease protein
MKGLCMFKAIYLKQLTELFKEKRILVMLLLASLIMLYLPYQLFSKISFNESIMKTAMDFYFIFYSIMTVLLLAYSANYNIFLQDKIKKTIHSLLSTPLNIKTIWLGKTLAIFTVGYILSLILSFIFLLILNNYIVPDKNIFPSIYGIISLLVINPFICILLIGNIGILTLVSKDETKVRIGFLVFLVAPLFFLKPEKLNVDLSILPYQIIVVLVLFIITYISLKFLSNEKVILSVD